MLDLFETVCAPFGHLTSNMVRQVHLVQTAQRLWGVCGDRRPLLVQVLITALVEEIRESTTSDHYLLVGLGAAALPTKFLATLLKPGVMDALPHALACCALTGWLSRMLTATV
jgi:hypothetical protein